MVIKAKLQEEDQTIWAWNYEGGRREKACDTLSHIRGLLNVCKCFELQRMWSGYWKKV